MSIKTPKFDNISHLGDPSQDFEDIDVEILDDKDLDTSKTPDDSAPAKESGEPNIDNEEDEFDEEGNPIVKDEEELDEEGNPIVKEEEEEEPDEELAQKEEEFVSQAVDYYSKNVEGFVAPKGVKDIDTLREVIGSNAIENDLEKRGSYHREQLKNEIKEEYGIDELELELLRGKKHGVDPAEMTKMRSLKAMSDKEYTPDTEKANRELYAKYYELKNYDSEDAKALINADIEKLKKNPVAYAKKLEGLKGAIGKFASGAMVALNKKITAGDLAIEAENKKSRVEGEKLLLSRKIGGAVRAKEDVAQFRKDIGIPSEEITVGGVKVKVTKLQKLMHERSVEEQLTYAWNLLYSDPTAEKKKKKAISARKAKGSFLKKKNRNPEQLHDMRASSSVKDSDGDGFTVEL